jgi:hypothetical protein
VHFLALCCLIFGLGGVLGGAPAHAQDFAAAGQHFASAQDAQAQGQHELAAKEYQAAYDITHDPALLLNIGESWQRAGNGPKAVAGYKAYLAAQPQAPDRAEIESRIQAIEAALADKAPAADKPTAADLKTPPDKGAAPTPPDKQGAAPPPQIGKTTAERPAPPPEKKATKPEAEAAPTVTPPEGPISGLRRAAWVGVAVSVALATAGAIVGMGAQNRADELRRRTTLLVGNQPPVYDAGQAEAYTTLMSEGNAYNQAAIALLSVAGAAALTTAVLFIADYARRPKPAAQPKLSWKLLPLLTPPAGATGATGGLLGAIAIKGSF